MATTTSKTTTFDCGDADDSNAKVEYELYLVRNHKKISKEVDTSGGSASARSCWRNRKNEFLYGVSDTGVDRDGRISDEAK